jgi:hypothetical protein
MPWKMPCSGSGEISILLGRIHDGGGGENRQKRVVGCESWGRRRDFRCGETMFQGIGGPGGGVGGMVARASHHSPSPEPLALKGLPATRHANCNLDRQHPIPSSRLSKCNTGGPRQAPVLLEAALRRGCCM